MLPAMALGVKPHHTVLDLCAAPGSKTMQLLEFLHASFAADVAEPPGGLLVANDLKSKRLNRLIERARRSPAAPLVATHCDARTFPNVYQVTTGRPSRVCFDRVLCDSPCSCDGTVRKARGLLAKWNPRAGLCHHHDQIAILCRGLERLKPGGLLAYSTCALNPVENEAVVAAALAWGEGSVELVQIDVPGLRLAEGLREWKVPSPDADAPGTSRVTFSVWDEVPLSTRQTNRIRRTMFPPAKDVNGEAITAQLHKCGRLLPAHDNGGCFFLALLRRVQHVEAPLRKGDRVFVISSGEAATFRARGTGPFKGLIRIAYGDGSFFHAQPEDVTRQSTSDDFTGSVEDSADAPALVAEPILKAVDEADWHAVATFYGLAEDADAAKEMGVQCFPRRSLVYGPDPHFDFAQLAANQAAAGASGEVADLRAAAAAVNEQKALCIASDGLRALTCARNARPVARMLFFRSSFDRGYAGHHCKAWPPGAFAWRPAGEAAVLLARYCSKRVASVPGDSRAKLLRLQQEYRGEPSEFGVDPSWPAGPVLLLGTGGVVLVGLLHDGNLLPVFQKGCNVR